MLFDLQSPGRRRVIKVVYALLAILLAVGLVGFGIGSDATGGLSEVFGGGSPDTGFEDEIEDAEKRASEQPRNERAQLELVTLYIQQGNQQLEVDSATGQTSLTPEAEESYGKAADAWDAYLKLKPAKPDDGTALQMANTFFLLAQSQSTAADARAEIENAAEAQQVAVDANPTRGNYGNLALYLFFAGDFAAAEQAVSEAIAKGGKDKQFSSIRQQAKAFEKQVTQEAKQGAAQGAQGGNPLQGGGGSLGGGRGSLATP